MKARSNITDRVRTCLAWHCTLEASRSDVPRHGIPACWDVLGNVLNGLACSLLVSIVVVVIVPVVLVDFWVYGNRMSSSCHLVLSPTTVRPFGILAFHSGCPCSCLFQILLVPDPVPDPDSETPRWATFSGTDLHVAAANWQRWVCWCQEATELWLLLDSAG